MQAGLSLRQSQILNLTSTLEPVTHPKVTTIFGKGLSWEEETPLGEPTVQTPGFAVLVGQP